MDEILSTLVEGLVKANERLDDLTAEINGFEGEYAKDKELIQNQIDNVYGQIDRLIKEAVAKIPKAKDGADAKPVDYMRIEASIKAKIQRIQDEKNADISELQSELTNFVIQSLTKYKPKDGADGANGSDGKDGRDGLNGRDGQKGDKGDDGRGIKDISLKDQTLTFEMSDNTKESVTLPTPTTQIIKTGGRGGTSGTVDVRYTNLTPTPVSIGGIPAGSTFDNMTMQEMWDALLYPYQTPVFSSFTSSMSTPIEVGATIPAGSVTFLWNTTNSSNIAANSIKIDDITAGNNLAAGLANTGTTAISISEITNVMATSHQWKITATNTKGAFLSRTLNVYWQWKIYYGESALTDLTETDVEALRVGTLAANVSGNYSFNAGEYKWICYPTSFGLKTTFKDASTNFDVAMQPALTKSITNSQGVATNYYCHRTVNKLGGSITIAIS